jgi:hypothetical protein
MDTTPPTNQTGERQQRWTPELIMQAFKEGVTGILGMTLVGYTLYIASNTLAYVGDKDKISDAKDVLLLVLGLAGVVIGYYFGRVPADARAAQAQEKADAAASQTQQVAAKADLAADQLDQILPQIAAPAGDAAARGAAAPPADVVADMTRIRDGLRELSRMGRNRV